MAETWHVYQEQTGAFFRSLGLGAEINKLVVGARARHKIDVAVEFERWGLRHLWIVECKQHQRPIEKADVETLKSIASDVGASVALLLAESGFQPGAISAARSTNVVLSSLTSLRDRAGDEILAEALAGFEARIRELRDHLRQLTSVSQRDPHTHVSQMRPGVDVLSYISAVGRLAMLANALDEARLGQFPVILPGDSGAAEQVMCGSLDEVAARAVTVLEGVATWLHELA